MCCLEHLFFISFHFPLVCLGDILLQITHETYGISVKKVGQGKDVFLCLRGAEGP